MALNGFPPSNLISPSVRIAEVDLSFLPAVQTGHRAGLVGFASKGPINIPTMVSTINQLHSTFGFPHPDVGDPYLVYAAEQYLQYGSELFIVRVGVTDPVNDEAAVAASVDVLASGTAVQIESNITGDYSFADDVFFRWKLNGILSSKTLVVLADNNRASPDTGNPWTVTDIVNYLNSQLVYSIDGIKFYWTNPDSVTGAATLSSEIAVESVFSYGPSASIEFVSVQNSLYGPMWDFTSGAFVAGITGLGQGMTAASLTGTIDRYPNNSSQTAGVFDFTGLTGLNLQIVIDGTDNILIDNVVQTVTLDGDADSIGQLVDEINAQLPQNAGSLPGGFVASRTGDFLTLQTLHSGRDARLLVKASSTASALFGLDNHTHLGTSPSGVTGSPNYNDGIVVGDVNSGGIVCFTLTADSPGIDGNSTQVVINSSIVEGTFSLGVFSYGSQVEQWGGISKDPSNTFYVEAFLALVSSYIKAIDNTDTLALPTNGTYTLVGGTDGIPADPDDQDILLVGNSAGLTGLYSLSDPEQVNIDLIALPGHPSTNNILSLLDFCANVREDCFAIIEPPFGLSVTEITQWQNGVHPLNDIRFDSNFGALYWPWVKIRDTFNRVSVWVPPAGVVLGAFANSDNLAAPWIAPAGTTRGILTTVEDVFTRPSQVERDSMYGNRNAVNPIISFPDINAFCIFGQKTLQRRPSALDRVNVRRMLLFIEKQIKLRSRALIFEPNDPKTWSRFINMATQVLTTVQNGRGITDFRVVCDATINTADTIARNELHARIGVVPTYAIEFIFIEFALFASGSNFQESNTF
jgi:hypothetical protein